jgi:predicted GNAT family N-acyltransferase
MKIEQIETEQDIYRQALELRYELFFKEFELPIDIVQDEIESSSKHFGMTQENYLVAYGRLTDLGERHFKISQVVVQSVMQGKGHGKRLLEEIIKVASLVGAKTIELNSQTSATAIYRSLGFKETGNHYPSKSTGVQHVKMLLECAI